MAHAIDEPFGSLVDDWHAGIGPAVAINMNRSAKPGQELPPPVNPFDLIPWRKEEVAPPAEPIDTPEQIAAKLRDMLTRKGKAAQRNHGD